MKKIVFKKYRANFPFFCKQKFQNPPITLNCSSQKSLDFFTGKYTEKVLLISCHEKMLAFSMLL